jgi:hypothetical protein
LYGGKSVLFAGGDIGSGPSDAAGVYNSENDTFAPTHNHMTVARDSATASLLVPDPPSNNVQPLGMGVLIAGGYNSTGTLDTAEIYEQNCDCFNEVVDHHMTVARYGDVAVALPHGEVLIAGGVIPGGQTIEPVWLSSAEIYDKHTGNQHTGTFTATGSMTTPRNNFTATLLLNGRVLVVGTPNVNDVSSVTSDLYQP